MVKAIIDRISIVLTFVLAGFTLTGAFASYISPASCYLIAFLGLALPLLLFFNLIVAVYWSIRWKYWAFVPLIAIACNAGYLSRIFQLSFSTNTPVTNVLGIATYNVDGFGNDHTSHTCTEVARYMKEHNIDIICFQEFAGNNDITRDSIKAIFSDWPYQLIPTSDSLPVLPVALFSKFPIKDSRLITYPGSNNCSMWGDIEVNGQTIRIFNNHLQTTEVSQNRRRLEKELYTGKEEGAFHRLLNGLKENFTKRASQAEEVQRLIQATPYPTLVCGDLNSLPSSYTYHTIKGSRLKDGFQTCGHGYMYTYRYFKRLLRIDYIFHTEEFEGIDYYSPTLNVGGDHNPVVMKVRIVRHVPLHSLHISGRGHAKLFGEMFA